MKPYIFMTCKKLEGILSPQHLEEMEFAHSLRQNQVNIKMCQYSYELLLQYLLKMECKIMLGIVNERINFQVFPRQPCGPYSSEGEVITLTGSSQEAVEQINQKNIHWGILEDSLEEILEKEILAAEVDKNEAKAKEGDGIQGRELKAQLSFPTSITHKKIESS